VTFEYGQRNPKELEHASAIAKLLGFEQVVVPCGIGEIRRHGMTTMHGEIGGENRDPKYAALNPRCVNPYVPGRNMLFAFMVGTFAAMRGCDIAYVGTTHMGGSRYPDCRPEALDAVNVALRECLLETEGVRVIAPLQTMTKNEVVRYGLSLPWGEEVLRMSYTCHNNEPPPGCGRCYTCEGRVAAFAGTVLETL
jgi:7-cyano-7-deazaguanine synthase